MNKEYIQNILYELYLELETAIDKINYNNQDFICECCLEVKCNLIRIQELQELLEEEFA